MASFHLMVCDDVRSEVGGKKSFMGVYGSEIQCPEIPIQFPKMCFVVSCETPAAKPFHSLSFQIDAPGSPPVELPLADEEIRSAFKKVAEKEKGRFRVMTELVAMPFQLKKEGVLRVYMKVNGRKRRVGSIKIMRQSAESSKTTPKKLKNS